MAVTVALVLALAATYAWALALSIRAARCHESQRALLAAVAGAAVASFAKAWGGPGPYGPRFRPDRPEVDTRGAPLPQLLLCSRSWCRQPFNPLQAMAVNHSAIGAVVETGLCPDCGRPGR